MPFLHDLIEVTGFASGVTLDRVDGDLLDVHDSVFWNGSGDIDEGNTLTIGGLAYTIDRIQKLDGSSVTFTSDEGTTVLTGADEGNLQVMFLEVSSGGVTRSLILPNDSVGDLTNITRIAIGTITDVGGSDASITAGADDSVTICFAADTWIATGPEQAVRAGDLAPGMQVLTADRGLRPLRWVGSERLDPARLARYPHLAPIRIAAGALGPGRPQGDLLVSPQHRILIRSKVAERMVGTAEVLVAAKHLLGLPGIAVAADVPQVTYCHLLLDRHEILFANGAAAESLLPGPMALQALGSAARRALLRAGPDLSAGADPARPCLPGRLGRSLALRHGRNRKPLLAG